MRAVLAETLGARISGSGRSFSETFARDLDLTLRVDTLRVDLTGVDRVFDGVFSAGVLFAVGAGDFAVSRDLAVATTLDLAPLP